MEIGDLREASVQILLHQEMTEKLLKAQIFELEKKIEILEGMIKDLQAQQLEINNNIITLIQHAETMNNVTDASGLLAEHVTDLENRLNLVIDWMKEEIRIRNLNQVKLFYQYKK